MNKLSRKQIDVIANFGKLRYRIHVGPYGCGKTYGLIVAFGLHLAVTKPGKLGYLLVGKTAGLAKSTMGDELSSLFGSDFKWTQSKKEDSLSKDALLFGHRLYFGGMSDKESIKRVLGKSYKGILADELTSFTLEHFKLLQGRLRGESHHWFEGSTNPDGPVHWLKEMLDKDAVGARRLNHTKWTRFDNICDWAEAYYNGLMEDYKYTPAYYSRYIDGEWAAADCLVYGDSFRPKHHIIDDAELVDAQYKYFKIGIDFGMENPTVALLVGVMPGGEHVIIKEYYKAKAKNTTELEQGIIQLVNNTPGKIRGIWIDPSASGMYKNLRSAGLYQVQKGDNDVLSGISEVHKYLTNDRLFIAKSCINTINEFLTYSYSKKDGEIVEKTSDHCLDALRYLIYSDR